MHAMAGFPAAALPPAWRAKGVDAVLAGSGTTRFSIAPRPSISMRTTSPAFRKRGGFIAPPTPPGVSVTITSPGSRVKAVLR